MDTKGNALKIIDFPEVRTACRQCSLAEICLPRGLSPADLELLERTVKPPLSLGKGELVFRAGTPLDALHVVRSGSVKLIFSAEDGNEQLVGFYLPGELIGLDGIETGTHTCTAATLEMSSICTIPYRSLNQTCQQIPTLHEQFQRIVGREINNENRHLLLINKKSAEQRMATFLLSISGRFARLGYSASEFHLPMSRQELGDFLGLAIETVSRVLGRFQKAGLVSINHRLVQLHDFGELNRICEDTEPSLYREQS